MDNTTVEIIDTLILLSVGVIITYYQTRVSKNDDI